MSPNLEIHSLAATVLDIPRHFYLIILQFVSYRQSKRPGILLQRLRVRLEPVAGAVLRSRHQRKVHIPRKAVLAKEELFLAHSIPAFPQAADDGEEHRRMPLPERRVRLPEVLGSVLSDTCQFCSALADADRQDAIFQSLHTITIGRTIHR